MGCLGDIEVLQIAKDVLRTEAEGILNLIEHLDQAFARAVEMIFASRGRVIVAGIGKSGLVGRKIVATLSSTGTPAMFIHPVEAMHGDLGMVRSEDVVLALSNSGETEELNVMLPSLRNIGTRIIAMTGNVSSTLARNSDLTIYTGVQKEACPFGLAPTASTTALLAMGDALAVALTKMRNFQVGDFRRYHPGGHLGERLKVPLYEVMRHGDAIPSVQQGTCVVDALQEMDRKGLGATLVIGDGCELLGIFTDGDLRRAINRHLDLAGIVVEEVMTKNPLSISAGCSVADALELMEKRLVTVLPVKDAMDRLQGILHLHDLLGKGKIRFTR
jgi:arabinose-5-phosphate isomerase